MSAGRMDTLVTLQFIDQDTRSESGSRKVNWVDGDKVWADIEDLRGQLFFAADQANSKTTARIRIYYRDDVAKATGKTLRIKDGDTVYLVEGRPIRLKNRSQLELMVYERV